MGIVVYDSGIGGLSILSYLLEKQSTNVVYFMDNRYFPYGEKTIEQLIEIVGANLARFSDQTVMIACNTASMIYENYLPKQPNVYSIIDRTIQDVLKDQGAVGLIGTDALVESNIYQQKLMELGFQSIVSLPSSPLVVHVESNNKAGIKRYIEEQFTCFKAANITQLILGCTHFNWLIPHLNTYFEGKVRLIPSGFGVVDDIVPVGMNQKEKQQVQLIMSEENPLWREKFEEFIHFNHNLLSFEVH